MKKIMLFSLIFIFSAFNALTQSGWVEKKSEVGNFYLTFPNMPTFKSGSDWTSKDKNGQVTYFMSFKEFPSNNKITIEAVEKYLLPSMMEGDIQVSKNYLTFSGFKAIDFLYRTNENPILYKKGRIIIRNNNVYILQVHYYFSNLADFDKFSKSLRFY
jgi:hypothetical protein